LWSQLGATCSRYPYTRLNFVNCVFRTRKKKGMGREERKKERKWQRKEEIKKEKRDRNSRKRKC
jgi:hypothetical protein